MQKRPIISHNLLYKFNMHFNPRKSQVVDTARSSCSLVYDYLINCIWIDDICLGAEALDVFDGTLYVTKVNITESIIRRDFQLEDANGIDCLPNATIFEQLTLIGMVKNVDSMVKFWMYLRFVQVFVNKQVGDMSHHKRIYVTPSHTKKIFGNMKRERKGFSWKSYTLISNYNGSSSGRNGKPKRKDIEIPQSSGPTEPIADEAANEENVPTHSNDPLLSGEDSLKLNKLMELYTNLQKKVLDLETSKTTQALEIESLKRRVKKLQKKRFTHFDTDPDMFGVHDLHGDEVFVETEEPVVNIATTTSTIPVRILLQEPSETRTTTTTTIPSKDKGKVIMVEEPFKKKEQIRLDEELSLKLQDEEEEQARLAREKAEKDEEANIL
ncbi:hypothetical protein Tco_0988889 [Tanacetum coccineum]|uniref:Ulp1-like peptidase n=1 Tax=Tanacetum coccineum TaxID=301880 RepID=A0ABQ5ET72_9ASTR